jgi:diguanylate cyclase (GGDEF)-like protein
MLTRGGPLLEHFARLAANVAGTSAAVVGLLGARKSLGPGRAAFGLSREQLAAFMEVEAVLASCPKLTIVPDLAEDHRFHQMTAAQDHLGIRFLANMQLISPGGQQVGYICLLDRSARSNLTEAEIASLGHVASLVMADRRRAQRHLHLMHVADRALRVDEMLRLVSSAASCAEGLTKLLEALCHFHGAAVGQIWQLVHSDEPLVEISHYHQDQQTGTTYQAMESLVDLNSAIADAIRRNRPHALKLSEFKTVEGFGDASTRVFAEHVCVPIWVQQQRFGISLTFTTENAELDAVVADIASLGDTIRPALFQKVTEERLRFAAHHDHLTQLSNRLMFQDCLRKTIAATRSTEQRFAVLCLDLDGFKQVNDTRGHEVGDSLLVAVAQRLRDNVRESDTVSRMGGDEFAIIQPLGHQPAAAVSLAERLVEALSIPFNIGGRPALIGVSIGIALYPQHGDNADLLLRHADLALYGAKNAGRRTHQLFDPAVSTTQRGRRLVEQDLRDAINRGDLTLAYQPVCESESLEIVGFEALVRWHHPSMGLIEPDEFIPMAENSGLIVPLGQWVLEKACEEAATWDPAVLLSVNLSPLQFRHSGLPEQIADILRRTGLPATRLRLEVTEGLLLDESDLVLRTMRQLQAQGICIMLDDFGTAYAAMSYLRRFPFNGIKIDKSFARDICINETTLAIVQAILSLGDRLQLVVVAEGVETHGELDLLRKLGCRFVQGYLLGTPSDGRKAHTLRQRQSVAHAGAGSEIAPYRSPAHLTDCHPDRDAATEQAGYRASLIS